jgi:hypothetical protein
MFDHSPLIYRMMPNCIVFAQSGCLILEAEQDWETYRVGRTCIPGSHNLFVEDIDLWLQVTLMRRHCRNDYCWMHIFL